MRIAYYYYIAIGYVLFYKIFWLINHSFNFILKLLKYVIVYAVA